MITSKELKEERLVNFESYKETIYENIKKQNSLGHRVLALDGRYTIEIHEEFNKNGFRTEDIPYVHGLLIFW